MATRGRAMSDPGTKRRGRKRADGEGTLYFDAKRKLWIGEVMVGYLPNGKPDIRRTTARRQDDCKAKLEDVKAKASGGTLPPREKARDTVAAFLDRWVETVRPSLRSSTHKRYADIVRLHLKPWLGRHRLVDLKPDHIQGFYSGLLMTI